MSRDDLELDKYPKPIKYTSQFEFSLPFGRIMAGPVVAFLGATGAIGSPQVPAFLEALAADRLRELRILVSEGKVNDERVQGFANKGAKIIPVNYSDVSSLQTGLNGATIVISAIKGPETDMIPTWNNLLEAIVGARVKIYFPSEFDAPLEKAPVKNYSHPWWDFKRKHFKEAQALGIKTIRMSTGCIPDFILSPFLGYDVSSNKWSVIGEAADKHCSVISHEDIGKFTCEAAIYAYKNPANCPDEFEVYSEVRTLREYASALDKASGNTTTFESTPFQEVKDQYKSISDPMVKFVTVVKLIIAEGGCDYRQAKGNELLNPNQSKWKLMKFEDYASEFRSRMTRYTELLAEMQARQHN